MGVQSPSTLPTVVVARVCMGSPRVWIQKGSIN